MNFDELDNSTTAPHPGHSVDPEKREHKHRRPSQEAPGVESIPSDPEWVSPFTLPPLPALRKTRGQSHLLRSPEERLHERTTSSAYYAAAWGSPYATPSPNRSPPLPRSSSKSQDLETASPLSTKIKENSLQSGKLRKPQNPSKFIAPISSSKRRRANSWDRQKSLSERFNWLSESDLSGSEADGQAGETPTREKYLKSLKASVNQAGVPRSRTHQVQESTATITPETFHAGGDQLAEKDNSQEIPLPAMDQNNSESQEAQPNGTDKPLPSLPNLNTERKPDIVSITASPDSPSRPRMQTMQSFQRPKKKVVWKGKTCIIALPLTDRESAGLPPLLGRDEIEARMEKWIAEGYDVDKLNTGDSQKPSGFGQSRSLYPDPSDMHIERKDGKLHVRIPDQSEWEAWVEYLKEERLRALGVTPSNSEAPMSVQSPFSSTLSRVSSTYPSIAASPPIGTLSANGNPVRIASNTFSPSLGMGPQNGSSSHNGSRTGSHVPSPSISGYPPMPMHAYKQSIAQQRMASPFEYPVSHPGSFGAGVRNPSSGYGMRQFSPPSAPNLQSFGQVLSPIIPTVPSNDNGRGIPSNPTMEQIRQQQQRQQQLHQQMMHHQRQQSYFPIQQSRSAEHLPRTPVLESPSRHTPEIMHPTPRSHRHNLSAALQKGVDDAEAARDERKIVAEAEPDHEEKSVNAETDEKIQEEEPEPELPVLKRPETMRDVDDKSEIETNPSIAASPMLMDDKNPFAAPFPSFQQIKNVLQPQSQHKPTSSISKLNVGAPEFSPGTGLSSQNFTFGSNSLSSAPTSTKKSLSGGSRPSFTPKNLSLSKLNVEAPTFTPSFVAQSTPAKDSTSIQSTPAKQSINTPSKTSFTFSSPAFNVEAPEFKPGQSFSFAPSASRDPEEPQVPFTSAGSIFGNVVIDPHSRVNRRGTKVLPIVRPKSAEEQDEQQEEDDNDDDEGRVGAPSDRQKRARRSGEEEDEQLLFAESAPFNHADGLTSKNEAVVEDQAKLDEPSPEDLEEAEAKAESAQHSSDQTQENVEAVEDKTSAPTEDLAQPESQPDLAEKSDSEPILPAVADALDESLPSVVSGTPADNVSSTLVEEPAEDSGAQASINELESEPKDESELEPKPEPKPDLQPELQPEPELTKPAPESNHKPKFSFSALAKPFEFRSEPIITTTQSQQVAPKKPSQSAPEPKASRGLMASRFAATPSPEPEPKHEPEPKTGLQVEPEIRPEAEPEIQQEVPTTVDRNASPPRELYEYIRPDEADLDKPLPLKSQAQSETDADRFTPILPSMRFETTPQLMRSIEQSMRFERQAEAQSHTPSQASRIDEAMPSYEEIDAVMKQFENNPDLGVERDDSPVKSTPLVDMRLPPTFRSDAPSPSPRHLTISPQRRADFGLGIHKLNEGNEEVSDWNEEFSPLQESKLQAQAQYFDGRVNSLVDSLLEHRLGPLEHSLQTIQHSIARIAPKPRNGGRRSMSTDKRDSDADDEDDYDAFEGFSSYRSRSPSRGNRKADKIRNAIMEGLAAYQPPVPEQPALDLSEFRAAIDEMKAFSQKASEIKTPEQPDMRALMEEVISNHPRFKTPSNQDDHEALQETYKLKMDVLESSLKEAERKAEDEVALRRQIDDDMQQLNRKLLEAKEEAATHREASEEAQASLIAFAQEKKAYHELESNYNSIFEKNKALEKTLDEYRVSHDQFKDEIKLERARNQDLIRMMHNLREDFNDKLESRQALRGQMERLQDRMTKVLHDVHADEAEWRSKEHDLIIRNKTTQAALDHEVRHREKIELELDDLDKEHKEAMRFRTLYEHAQQDIARLQEQVVKAGGENKSHQDQTFKLERELAHVKDITEGEVAKATTRLGAELQAARATIESLQTDSEAQISRLQNRLDDAELDLEEQKAKHETAMADTADAHSQALHEANQKRENDLEEQHKSHEKKLNDLRDRHTRALHNSSDDRHRLEYQLNEKLELNEEKTKHLQSQVKDLEERLEITKSAARAAVEAATAKANATATLPTPAPSVVASPPHRASSGSVQMMKGSDVPEKISPQALRETILVLQDQLQNREQKIEQLESELEAVDKEAPVKVKERDNEIALLRELLSVRVDDLDEIIATLAQPKFDREATKNAAIRLKANLQMEQQLRERAVSTNSLTSSLPSISAISSIAQSPRGLPMAAAAAWGNWRKARDFSLNAVSDIATNISQTPSKSGTTSPSGFLAGIMTPPSASRTPPPSDNNPMSPPMRPLAAAVAARKNAGGPSEARPLRTYSTQARTLSSRQAEKRRESNESTASEASKSKAQRQPETPTTPTTSRSVGNLDLGDDVDEDASPFNPDYHEVETTEAEAVAT